MEFSALAFWFLSQIQVRWQIFPFLIDNPDYSFLLSFTTCVHTWIANVPKTTLRTCVMNRAKCLAERKLELVQNLLINCLSFSLFSETQRHRNCLGIKRLAYNTSHWHSLIVHRHQQLSLIENQSLSRYLLHSMPLINVRSRHPEHTNWSSFLRFSLTGYQFQQHPL